MPAGGLQYTLAGFDVDVDWRPLRFVKHIPQNKICQACGLVRRRTALLPCMHLLCESCYEECAQDGGRSCPLDNCHWPDGDVDWKETSADEILKREVACWNEEKGCDVLMPAAELTQHFQSECGHHSFSCPQCSATVLCRDVCVHLRSHSERQTTTPGDSQREGQSRSSDEGESFYSFKRALEQMTSEIISRLERPQICCSSPDRRLEEICQNIAVLNETLTREMAMLKEDFRDQFRAGRLREEINELKECSRELAEVMRTTQEYFSKGSREIQASTQHMTEYLTKSETQNANASNESLEDLTEAVRQIRGSLAGSIRDILVSNEHIKEALMERMEGIENICGTVKASSSALKTEFIAATKENSDNLARVLNAFEDTTVELKENCRKTYECTRKVIWLAEIHVENSVFFVEEVEQHRICAVDNGVAYYFHGPVYIAGYCISPGVTFVKAGRSVTVHVAFILCKGYRDEPARLPAGSKIRLSFIHPQNNLIREMVAKLSSFPYAQRPVRTSNGGLWFTDSSSRLEVLVRDGYLHGDRLCVKWELLV